MYNKLGLILHNKKNLCPGKKSTKCSTCLLSALACQEDMGYLKTIAGSEKNINTILIIPLCGINDMDISILDQLQKENYTLELFLCSADNIATCTFLDYFNTIFIADNFDANTLNTAAKIIKVNDSFLKNESILYCLNNKKYATYAALQKALVTILHLELDIHSKPIIVDSDTYFTKAIVKTFTLSKRINEIYRPNYVNKELLVYYDYNNDIYDEPQKGICEEKIADE